MYSNVWNMSIVYTSSPSPYNDLPSRIVNLVRMIADFSKHHYLSDSEANESHHQLHRSLDPCSVGFIRDDTGLKRKSDTDSSRLSISRRRIDNVCSH